MFGLYKGKNASLGLMITVVIIKDQRKIQLS